MKNFRNWFESQLSMVSGYSNIGIARSILAIGTLLTLLTNSNEVLFVNLGAPELSIKENSISIFNLLGVENISVSKIICAIILLFVIVGVWPRFTSLLHWWVCYSFFNSAQVLDGGDQITLILVTLLLPTLLLNNSRNHFVDKVDSRINVRIVNYFSILLIRFQIYFLYFQAATSNLGVDEWRNGTAVYYFLENKAFGGATFLQTPLQFLFEFGIVVVVASWGAILIELLLSAGFFIEKQYWNSLFWLGVTFHLCILLFFGLSSFTFAMMGALILYYKPFRGQLNLYKIA